MPVLPPSNINRRVSRAKHSAGDLRRKHKPDLAAAQKIRSSSRWQRVRLLALSCNPLCCDPFKLHKKANEVVSAEEVHHIIGLTDDLNKAYDLKNLACLCSQCHHRIEARVRLDHKTYQLFEGLSCADKREESKDAP